MAKFIKLTDPNAHKLESELWVAVGHIKSLRIVAFSSGAILRTAVECGADGFMVTETPEQILKLIEDAS